MTALQKLVETYEQLPEELQIELLDFTGYLAQKNRLDREHKRAELDEMIRRDGQMDEDPSCVIEYDDMMKRIQHDFKLS